MPKCNFDIWIWQKKVWMNFGGEKHYPNDTSVCRLVFYIEYLLNYCPLKYDMEKVIGHAWLNLNKYLLRKQIFNLNVECCACKVGYVKLKTTVVPCHEKIR